MKDVPESKLIGTYNLVYPFGTETLTLRPDHKYTQLFVYTSGQRLFHTERWKMDHIDGQQVVLFNGMQVDNGFGEQAAKSDYGNWGLGVQDWNNHIELDFNPDFDFAFRKVQ